MRLAHQPGGDFREGDNPTDPSAYRFAVEMGGEEWFAVYRMVANHLGGGA